MAIKAHDPPRHLTVSPLRVGFIAWEFPVISETFVSTLAADLVRSGIDLSILSYNPDFRLADVEAIHPEVSTAGLLDKSLYAFAPPPAVAKLRGALMSALALLVPQNRIGAARLAMGAGPFDVVHCHFGTLGLAALRHRELGLLQTRALIVHFRGYDITRFVNERGNHVYDRLFRHADHFIANSTFFRDKAIALGCPKEKITVIGSPIDLIRFAPLGPQNARGDATLRLVAVGRLVEKKGIADAIEAVGILHQQGLDVHLSILGDGPLRKQLSQQISQLGLKQQVSLRGSCTTDQVIAALQAADIALAPSVTAADGDADAAVNTLKEAMATELAVVATRHGGIPELVRHGENGLLVPEHSPSDLAEAIRTLAQDPSRRREMGRMGRKDVKRLFDRTMICDRTLDVYKACLA